MLEIFIENVTLKAVFNGKTKAIRTAINEFIGYILNVEKNDDILYLDMNIVNINIYCIEKDFFKLIGNPKENFEKLRIKINLTKNYVDESILEKDKKISISTAILKDKEIIDDVINIFKRKIFVVKDLS